MKIVNIKNKYKKIPTIHINEKFESNYNGPY